MLPENPKPFCPECEEHGEAPAGLDRRNFIKVVGGQAAVLATLGTAAVPTLRAADTKTAVDAKVAIPAEALIRELYTGLSAEQKQQVCMPWDHERTKGMPTRLGMYNGAIGKKIGDVYTKPQQELVERILKSICSGDTGWRCISRGGTWDGSGSFTGIGANIFGEPVDGKKFAMVFAGHHLTVRCDGNSEEGAAFGGPMYYGHSPNGYSDKNVFNFQTQSVLRLFDSLNAEQQKKAITKEQGREHADSVRFRNTHPGVSIQELTKDQKELVEKVMRDLVSLYRKEDGDEVMEVIKKNGGMEKIHLAFYGDRGATDNQRWHFWRLEGPGFVWNYRVLPHVHCYVNISSKV